MHLEPRLCLGRLPAVAQVGNPGPHEFSCQELPDLTGYCEDQGSWLRNLWKVTNIKTVALQSHEAWFISDIPYFLSYSHY